MAYKWCVVPLCTNTSIKTPEKMFVSVPKNVRLRKKWLQLAHRNPNDMMVTSNVYFCEDHFEMEKVIANYYQYKMGFSQRLLLVHGALPSKFHCQHDVKQRLCSTGTSQAAFNKRKNINFFQQCHQDQFAEGNLTKDSTQDADREMREGIKSECSERPQTQNDETHPTEPVASPDTSALNASDYNCSTQRVPCDVKVCRICFVTDCKLYSMKTYDILCSAYGTVTGLSCEESIPPFLCSECVRRVLDCARFRTTSLQAHSILLDIFKNHDYVTVELIKSAKGVQLPLNLNQNDDLNIELMQKENAAIDEQTETGHLTDVHEHVAVDVVKTEYDGLGQSVVKVEDDRAFITSLHGDIDVDFVKTEKLDAINQIVVDVRNTNNDDLIDVPGLHEDPVGDDRSDNYLLAQDIVKVENRTNDDVMDISTLNRNVSGGDDKLGNDVDLVRDIKVEYITNDDVEVTSRLHGDNSERGVEAEANDVRDRNIVKVENANDDLVGTSTRRLNRDISEGDVNTDNDDVIVKIENTTGDSVELDAVLVVEASQKAKLRIIAAQAATSVPKGSPQAKVDSRGQQPPADGLSEDNTLSCAICPYRASNKLRLSTHVKAHAAAASYSCNKCSYITINRGSLINHLKSHSDEKLYSCDVCCKTFKQKRILKMHLRTRCSEKPLSCCVCHKAFKRRTHFTIHMRKHSGERSFSCDMCHREFICKLDLTTHMKSQCSERSFSYDTCNGAFKQKPHLATRLKTHPG